MMAVKIQAFYRGWKGRRRFRSKLAAHRAQESFVNERLQGLKRTSKCGSHLGSLGIS